MSQVITVPSIVDAYRPVFVNAFRRRVPMFLRPLASPLAPLLARVFLEIAIRLAAPKIIPILRNVLAALGRYLAPATVEFLNAILSLLLTKTEDLDPVTQAALIEEAPEFLNASVWDDPTATIFTFAPPSGPGPAGEGLPYPPAPKVPQ